MSIADTPILGMRVQADAIADGVMVVDAVRCEPIIDGSRLWCFRNEAHSMRVNCDP